MKAIILAICMLTSTIVSAQMNSIDATSATIKEDSIKVMESNFWYVVHHRRSVRKFKPDSIPDKDIVKIIDAARMAPTSGNQQPWKFLIIKDRDKINLMQAACITRALGNYEKNKPYYKGPKEQYAQEVTKRYEDYFSAPVYIVVLTDNNSMYPNYNHWDGPLGAGYLMLAARALGYGTVFITDAISEEITKTVLKIPENYTRVCITPLGIPYEWPEAHDKKNLEDFIIREKF